MTHADNYADLVRQAEGAVESVKDPELKRVAFEKVLDDLLGAGSAKSRSMPPSTLPKRAASAKVKKTATRRGPKAYIEELIGDEFFKKPKTIAQVKAELENRGHHIPLTSLSGPLQKLCQGRKLRRQRTSDDGKKPAFNYSNW